MGVSSSQPVTQNPPAEEASQSSTRALQERTAVVMEDPVQTPDTTKSKSGKLKTYAKQRASAKKPRPTPTPARMTRSRMASEELGEQPTLAQPAIPPTIAETPVQAKAARKSRRRKVADAVAEPEEAPEEAPVDDASVDDASAEMPTKTKQRKHKKKKKSLVEEVAAEQQLQEELHEDLQQVQVPETQEEQPDEAQDEDADEPRDHQDVIAESEPEVADEAAEPLDEEAEQADGDTTEFEVPPDSGDDEEQEAEPSKKAKATKKRKRPASGTTTPEASVKRRKSNSKAQATVADYPDQGPFTPVEADLIESYLVDYCSENALDKEQLINMIQSSSRELSKVYVHLADEVLPQRNRRAIQRYVRRHYNNYQRGRWTSEQDDLLKIAYAENPNKWVAIGAKVGRMPEDCRDRWRNHISLADTRNTDVWTQDEEHQLASVVRECLAAVEEKLEVKLSRENEDDYIAWPVVVQKMNGSRNRLQCSMKWRKIKARIAKEEAEERKRAADGSSSPKKNQTRWKQEAKRRFDEMLIGDMYAITLETQYGALMGRFANKATFWTVTTRLNGGSPWTTADRKLVYKNMRKNINDTHDFNKNLQLQVEWFKENFDEDALQKRSKAYAPKSAAAKRILGGYMSAERVSGSDDEDEEPQNGEDMEMGEAEAEEEEELEDDTELGPEINGNGNGEADGEEEPQSPHVSESAPDDEEDYKQF